MRLEKYNAKTKRYEYTKSEDEISHQIIGESTGLKLGLLVNFGGIL